MAPKIILIQHRKRFRVVHYNLNEIKWFQKEVCYVMFKDTSSIKSSCIIEFITKSAVVSNQKSANSLLQNKFEIVESNEQHDYVNE